MNEFSNEIIIGELSIQRVRDEIRFTVNAYDFDQHAYLSSDRMDVLMQVLAELQEEASVYSPLYDS